MESESLIEPLQASSDNAAMQAKELERDRRQFDLYRQGAEEDGDAASQFELGYCYLDGIGCHKDEARAVTWFDTAAHQGHSDAQCMLGSCYEFGCGISKDTSKAVYWYSQAAKQEHGLAQWRLAVCYRRGTGVERDLTTAVEWAEKAAGHDVQSAQQALEELRKEQEDEKLGKKVTEKVFDEDPNRMGGAVDYYSEVNKKKPVYKKTWFIFLLGAFLLAGVVAAIVGAIVSANSGGSSTTNAAIQDINTNSAPTMAPTAKKATPSPTWAPTVSNDWVQLGTSIVGEFKRGRLGHEVAISSDGTVMAAVSEIAAGRIRVFRYDAANTREWIQMGQDIVGVDNFGDTDTRVALSGNGTTLLAGYAVMTRFNSSHPDTPQYLERDWGRANLYTYLEDSNEWVQVGPHLYGMGIQVLANGNELKTVWAPGERFGQSVTISADGRTLAIGARLGGPEANQGGVFLYQWQGDHLNATLVPYVGNPLQVSGPPRVIFFGFYIALSGDGTTLAVGAILDAPPPNYNTQTGAVYIYKLETNAGGLQLLERGGVLGAGPGNQFGAVAINNDGSMFVGGSRRGAGFAGYMFVYRYAGTSISPADNVTVVHNWAVVGGPIIGKATPAQDQYDLFGRTVSMNGDGTVVAGGGWWSEGFHYGNVARVYELNPGNDTAPERWDQKGSDFIGIVDYDPITGARLESDEIGRSVAISRDGSTIVLGAPGDEGPFGNHDTRGTVRVYKFPHFSTPTDY